MSYFVLIMAIHMSAFAKIKYDFEQRAVGV